MKTQKRQKHDRRDEERGRGGKEGNSSNLLSLKIQNDNIHIKNIIRTIYHVYVSKYDYETGFSYIKDILKNIISGNVFDLEYNKYIDGNCIYELSARILLNIVRVHVKDVNFKKMVDFLFDMLYYCDGLLNEKKGVQKKSSKSEGTKGGESELVTKLWVRLIDNVFIKDKKQRLNLCKVVRAFLKKACAEQIDVPDKLYRKHVNVFLSLLNDKDHNIRTLCLHILEPFQDENTRNCFIKCFDDPHYIVRVTAIKNILIDPKELNNDGSVVMKAFIVRVNDTNAKVKISVYERMKSYYYCMPAMAKCELVLCGLNDKDKSVCESCYSMVIYWSSFFENRLENLLCSLIDGDYDTDGVVEHICKVHLSNAKKGNLKGNLKGNAKGRTSRASLGIEAEDMEEKEMNHGTGEAKITSYADLEEGTYDERWFNYCNENLLFLNPGELYMFRIYVQHFSDEQEKEKIDALQVVNAVYYYLYLSRFNESAYYQRKHYAYYMESVEDERHAVVELAECTCGKELIDSGAIEIERKRKYLETGEFDDECCDRCMFYISSMKKKMEEEIQDEKRGSGWTADITNSEKEEEKEKEEKEEEEEEDEFTHIQQDNINENYGNVCNIKNLLLICKCLDIIEIYQVEKIMKCCETVLLIGPLREVLIKCFIYSYGPGVINYRIQKGHIDCAHWLSNYYEYACLDLLRKMIFKKHGGQETEEAEVAVTNYILAILSEIKEPFDDPVKESSYLIGTRKRVQEDEANEGGEDSGSKPLGFPINGDEAQKKKSVESLTIPEICINIMDVEHDSVFSIIRKKDLSALKMVQLLLLTNKVQHKIDMTEARINDMSEVEMDRLQKKREREGIPLDAPLEDDAESAAYRAQLAGLTHLFIKQVCMLTVIKHHLKRRWLRILFITEVFLSRSKSQCSFDSGLGEFPDELLLPALNFASTIMSHVEDKEVEDNFFEILCTRCLGCWSLFINDEKKLLSQVHAYNTAILSTYTTYQQSLAKLEEMHSVICPIIYMRSNHDTMSHLERGPNRLTGTEEGYTKRGSNEDEDCLLPTFGSNTSLFYEYTSPGDYLIYHFEENPGDWSIYSDVLKQLELETLRCEIFMSVIGDIVMTHPLLYRNPIISEAVDNLWNFLNGSVNVSKYVQSICIRVCAKLLLIEYISVEESNTLTSTDFLKYMNTATLRLRTLCEMCFLISPASYLCLQDFKRVSSSKITNINVHDKAFLFSVLSLFPTMSETNLLLFHQTFEDVLLKTSTAVLKYKLKTDYYTNLLTFMVFTIIHKASATFLVENMGKYIKWFLLIIIEKGYKLTNRSQIVELLFRIVQVYLFQDLENINNFGSQKEAEKKEVKKRGRKRKVNPEETEQNQKEDEDKEDGDTTKGGETVSNENEKDLSQCTTICLKCVEKNVNEAIKELRCFFVLINFCIHSVDIIRSRTQVRYLENLKDSIEKQINEIKEQFIKNNLVETAESNTLTNSQQQEMEEKIEDDDKDVGLEYERVPSTGTVTNLLNLERLEKETEEDIYNEIIDDYVNYISQMDTRDFAYGIIPSDFRDSPENDELTNKEIMEQLNEPSATQLTIDQLNGGAPKVPKKRGRRRKVDIERERIMKEAEERRRQQEAEKRALFFDEEKNKQKENELEETVETSAKPNEETHQHYHNHLKHLEINATKNQTVLSCNIDRSISDANSSTQISVHPSEKTEVNYDGHRSTNVNKTRSSKKSPIRQTKEGGVTRLTNRKKVSDLNLSSSEDDADAKDSSVSDFESARSSGISDDGVDGDGATATDSDDSAEKTFNRLNRLRRTSYINVVNK